jgi:hypothetical protein
MAQVHFLLERHHRIVDVDMRPSWPYGIEEVCVTMEGKDIDLDFSQYFRHGHCPLALLPQALKAVMSAIWMKDEAESARGRP